MATALDIACPGDGQTRNASSLWTPYSVANRVEKE